MNKLFRVILFILFANGVSLGQNTVGLISYDVSKSYDGYNLIYPHNQPNVYLLNNCGEIVHTWEDDSDYRPGNTAYITDEGKLVVTSRPAVFSGDVIWAGGGGANIEIRDWDNNVEWSYTLNDATGRLHHDIAIVEKADGFNIMAIAWELKTREEAIEAGRDSTLISSDVLWPDYIFEIDPSNNEIVWEWHAWDHLIQDFDSTKSNYGVIADNPNKININHDHSGSGAPDWMHSNALDFDPINNLVLLCVPNFNEIWIIDHTTTTSQAATGNGGFSGLGGDLMYRWGNPAVYGQGTAEDQKVFFGHDANFIDDFIDPFDPNFGNIALFNNRVAANYSTVSILEQGFDMYTFSFPFMNDRFGPEDLTLNWVHPIDTFKMHSTGLSSMQVLPNSNYLVGVGRSGYSYEMTPEGEIVWEYITPLVGGQPATQGDTLQLNNNLTFRVKRYPTDYKAFEGRDLSAKGWIELEPNTNYCSLLDVAELENNYKLEIFPNPASDMLMIKWDAGKYISLDIYDMTGRKIIQTMNLTGGRKYIDTSSFESGLYIAMINGKQASKFIIHNN